MSALPMPSLEVTVEAGRSLPLGATVDAFGVNFSIFSQHATAVELLLFDAPDSPAPYRVVRFDPAVNKTYQFWHVYLRGLRPGAHYAYRVDGPADPARGHRFDRGKVLLDPYGHGHTTHLWNRAAACQPGDNLASSMRSVVIDKDAYDWDGDEHPRTPLSETVIYEMHVGGFTAAESSGCRHRGSFRGVTEKVPYLKSLGVTAVELLPVMSFDANEIGKRGAEGQPLTNYWGYSTVGFFAPHDGYCAYPQEGSHLSEFRDMVKALHRAGIEVILDVVFNHTSEGNHCGPTISFRGFENALYYHLTPGDPRYYMDYSGCGNTMNCNHPLVEKLIVDCLTFWVRDMHVDGFRFDEGSILSRGMDGQPLPFPPVIWNIELSEELAETKVIAEAWDAAGLYQIGYFPGFRWGEWNGRFRDDIRRFVRGDGGVVGEVAKRITGSADLYESSGHLPTNSINFVTCHDGFTMSDLVSYNRKHNEGNGEGNRDGIDENYSWNCGAEGETESPEVNALRERQIRNYVTLLMVSQGVPMLLMGDEVGRTQRGNNNAYCHNSDLNWFEWGALQTRAGLLRFVRQAIHFRKSHPTLHRSRFLRGEMLPGGYPDIAWHGCLLGAPGWDNPECRVLSVTLGAVEAASPHIQLLMNMEPQVLAFELPRECGIKWHRKIDTSLPSPEDIVADGHEIPIEGDRYLVNGHSIVVLLGMAPPRLVMEGP